MKKFKLIILTLFVIIITGCSNNYKEFDLDKFTNVVEEHSIGEIIDISSNYDYVKSGAQIINDKYNIEYLLFIKSVEASGTVKDEVTNIYNKYLENEIDVNREDDEDYVIYKITARDDYYVILVVDRSYLYLKSTKDNITNVDNFVNDLIK